MDKETRICKICGEPYDPEEVKEYYGREDFYDGYCQTCIHNAEDCFFTENERCYDEKYNESYDEED